MRWGFDARAAFLDPLRGFGRMVQELVPALAEEAGDALVVCVPSFAHVPPAWYSGGASIIKLRRPRRGAFLWDGPAWSWTCRRFRLCALHLPTWGVPSGVPVPVVATFHDATPLFFPESVGRWQRRRLRGAIFSLRRAHWVHAVSNFAARQLASLLPELGSRIVVVPHGVSQRFSPGDVPGGSFVLGVGGGEAHKNWEVVLRAYASPEAAPLPPLRLVGAVAKSDQVLQRVRELGVASRVQLLPQADEDTLVACYREALALVFPSRMEGFGLPALEAMACGCPVLAAAAGALAEVSGGAALLLPPDEPGAWLAALLALQRNPELRGELRQRGLARAKQFTWKAAARALVALYREAARCTSDSSSCR